MLTPVESCRTKRANNRLVASSIIAIRYNFSPRPSSHSCTLVSHCTSSPSRLRRGRQPCTCLTCSRFARHSLPRIIHCRTVSLLASMPCFFSKYSAAKVGPNPWYTGADKIFTASFSVLSSIRRFDGFPRRAVHHGLVAALLQPVEQPLHLPNAQPQLLGSLPLRNHLLLGFLQRHQPVSFGLRHE